MSANGPWKTYLRLIVALIVLGALAAWLWWPRAKKTHKYWVSFNWRAVRRIRMHKPGHQPVLLVKKAGVWRLTQPYPARADKSTIHMFLSELARIRPARRLGVASSPAYGFGHPGKVTLYLPAGKQYTFEFGAAAPTGEGDYLRLAASPQVIIAPDFLRQDAVRSAFGVQDKSLLRFHAADVRTVRLRWNHKTIVVRRLAAGKDKGKWPKALRSRTRDLVDALRNATMNSMPNRLGKAPEKYGLGPAANSITLQWKAGQGTIRVGRKNSNGDYFAQTAGQPAIYTISSYLAEDMKKLAAGKKA